MTRFSNSNEKLENLENIILNRFNQNEDGSLVSKKHQFDIKLNRDDLLRVVNLAKNTLTEKNSAFEIIQLEDFSGNQREFFCQYKENKNGQKRLNIIEKADPILSEGYRGIVSTGNAIHTGHEVAIKTVKPHCSDPKEAAESIEKEKKTILAFYQAVQNLIESDLDVKKLLDQYSPDFLPIVKPYSIVSESKESPQLVIEKASTGLIGHDIVNQGVASVRVVKDLSIALFLLEKTGFLHFDIKPENLVLVLDQEGILRAKLIDFGGARREVTQEEIEKLGEEETVVQEYSAPYLDEIGIEDAFSLKSMDIQTANSQLHRIDRVAASRTMTIILGFGEIVDNQFRLKESLPTEIEEIYNGLNSSASTITIEEILNKLDEFEASL